MNSVRNFIQIKCRMSLKNNNNFLFLALNDCYLKITPGPCRGFYPRVAYDKDSKTCVEFIYGGCLGNKNSFATLDECKEKCENPIAGK